MTTQDIDLGVVARGPEGPKGDQGDPGFYHYNVDLTDAKYDRNKWYYVEANGYQFGSLGGPSYFSLEAPLFNGVDISYGTHSEGNIKGASARQTVLYRQSRWGSYTARKLIVLDDEPSCWTTDGKRLLTFAVPSDDNLNYAFYARGGLKINVTSDVPGLTWTPHTDTLVTNGTTITVLNDAPDPKELGLNDDATFWALPMSQLKLYVKDAIPKGDPGPQGETGPVGPQGPQGPPGPAATAFQGTITSTSTDFNNLTSEGHYDIRFSPNTGKNGPNEGNWGLLDVKIAGRMVVQTYYGDADANVYVRNRRDGTTWTVWREITFWS